MDSFPCCRLRGWIESVSFTSVSVMVKKRFFFFFPQIWVIGTTFTVNWSTCSQSILEQGMQTQQNLNGLWTNIGTHLLHIWVISIYWTSLPLVRMKQKQEWDLIWWRRCCSHVALHQRNQRTRIQLCENYYNPLPSFFCLTWNTAVSLRSEWFYFTNAYSHHTDHLRNLPVFLRGYNCTNGTLQFYRTSCE